MPKITLTGTVMLATLAAFVVPAAAQERFTLADISFLTGCWAATAGGVDLQEQWTEASGGVMLGTTRFFRDGRVIDWEFGRFVEDEQGVTLWPYPKGTISDHGFPLVRGHGEYVFENLDHDFPVRIVYGQAGEDALRVRVEGRDGGGPRWTFARVACPG